MFGWGSNGGHIAEADLSAYADESVSVRLASRIGQHLTACAECARDLQELQATKSLLTQLPRATTTRSFTLGPEFAAQRPAPPRPTSLRGVLSFAPALTLSLLVALLLVDLLPGGGSGKSGVPVYSSEGASTSKAASATGPQGTPQAQILLAPSDAAPRAPIPAAPPGLGGANPTPQAATARAADNAAPSATPQPLSAQTGRPPITPGKEGFSPAGASTPLVPKPPLQGTAASARDSGVSLLRILEILAAVGFVVSAGVWVWERRRG